MPDTGQNKSLEFQKMCEIIAIAETGDTRAITRQVILHVLVAFRDEVFAEVAEIADTVNTVFGLDLSEEEIQDGIDKLIEIGQLNRISEGRYMPSEESFAAIESRIKNSQDLENKVKSDWLESVSRRYPALSAEELWKALNRYLALAFRRHGIQTTTLIDSRLPISDEDTRSLSALLAVALRNSFPSEQLSNAKAAISSFFASSRNYPERSRFIAQLADGAFNYFALVVSSDAALLLRQKLAPLLLFLDTNFLFGILNLHVNSQVEVSNRLMDAISKHELPFTLQFHKSTSGELQRSIDYYSQQLRSRVWTRSLSRSATQSRFVSGIERKYHEDFLASGIDVDSFLRPYEHIDEILKAKGIIEYAPPDNRMEARAELINEYKVFLEERGLDKPYSILDHDATLLDTVTQFQAATASTLESGAVLLTCDYRLYSFDLRMSRIQRRNICTVLPNVFWQILRPFIPSDLDFDRSFAETFAIPEFRTINSPTARASSKLLYILAGYQNIPEETATRMLSNDVLIHGIEGARNDQQVQALVESAIATENQVLLEEKAALERQLEIEKIERAKQQSELAANLQQSEQEKQTVAEKALILESDLASRETSINSLSSQIDAEKSARTAAEKIVQDETQKRKSAERSALFNGFVAALSMSAIVGGGAIWLVNYLKWPWLMEHPNGYALQGLFILLVVLAFLGLFLSHWRKALWGTSGLFAVGLLILSLLGGQKQ